MNHFDDTVLRIARALADRTRLRIMQEIVKCGKLSCKEVMGLVGLAQPTVSHHIRILTDAGLLTSRKNGRELILSANKAMLKKFARRLDVTLETH